MYAAQIPMRRTTAEKILSHPNAARGLSEVRHGRPFDWTIEDRFWAYERGRQLAYLVPTDMPLMIEGRVNPTVAKVFELAYERKLIR